jgi:hypothetical protein
MINNGWVTLMDWINDELKNPIKCLISLKKYNNSQFFYKIILNS